jgi:hypothetical protein
VTGILESADRSNVMKFKAYLGKKWEEGFGEAASPAVTHKS